MPISRLLSVWAILPLLCAILVADGATAETPPGYHGAVGRNLVLNPDFELGAQGWLYNGTWAKSVKTFTEQPKVPPRILPTAGVDGGACILLPERAQSIRSYCFPVKSGATYTISLDLRAPEGQDSGDVSLLLINPDWQVALWEKKGGIGKEWKRYSWKVTYNKSNHQGRAYLDIGSRSGLLVDRVLVAEGEDATYEAPVMMGLVSERYPYFVRGRDPAVMAIRIAPGTLHSGTASIKAVVRDAWSRDVWTRELQVPLDTTTTVPLELPMDALGNFHVEFDALQNGEVIGRGVSRYTIIDPPGEAVLSSGRPSPFGICQSLFAWAPFANEAYAPIVRDTGPRFNRFFAKAPRDLPYPWPASFIERQIELVKPAREAGIDLMACIQFFPGSFQCGDTSRMPTQEEFDKYRKCVKEYVTALSPYVRYWEIFNEPDLWREKNGRDRAFSPEKYLEVQKVAYQAIKDVDPDLVVVCNALNTMRWEWMERWFAAGGCRYMDYFSFHPYRSHPDQLNDIGVYADIMRAREMLDAHGGQHVGLINSEQLYGCHLFYDRKKTDEVRRGYYVDNDHELEAASRQVRNLIHHCAAGATCCPFTFREEFASLGPEHSLLVYDMLPAYNATTRFLADAGRGRPVDVGVSLRAFVFPEAQGGALAAVWTPISDAKGRMKLPGAYHAFDMMGNRCPDMEKTGILQFSTDPVWIRFTTPQTYESIQSALQKAEVRGVGEPIRIDAAVTGPNTLRVRLTSLINQPLSGTVSLKALPADWNAAETTLHFGTLEAGKATAVQFDFTSMPLSADAYEIVVAADTTKGPLETQQTLRPFTCSKGADRITADGDTSDWKDIPFVVLDDQNESKQFDPALRRQGDKDLSAKAALAWSEKELALLVIVTDDKHVATSRPAEAYQDDCVQVYFDQLNDATAAVPNSGDDISYTLTTENGKPVAWLSKGAEGNYKGEANQREGLADPEAKLAIKRTGAQVVYELVLPREACLPSVVLKPGNVFGFSLLVNDNDGKGRKTGLTLAPKGKEPYGSPAEYRDAVLQE